MQDVRVGDKLLFRCDNEVELWRCKGAFTKEPGTVKWIKSIPEGSVLYDVGANIGIYSLMAAARGVKVYAFEPHVGTAASLLRQVAANGFGDRVTVLTVAVGENTGFFPFHYVSKIAGSSGSQLGHAQGEDGRDFNPVATELKWTIYIGGRSFPNPTHVKIDVDGNELAILRGMVVLLKDHPPRSIQVEARPRDRDAIVALMAECGYTNPTRHDTEAGAKKIAEGADPATVTHNLVFNRE